MKNLLSKITKYDIALAAGLAVLSLFLLGLKFIQPPGGEVDVYVDNELIDSISLDSDNEYEYIGELGAVKVLAKEGKVRVIESNCPLKSCIRQGAVSRQGETIVCVPNKFLLVVTEGESRAVDGVVG